MSRDRFRELVESLSQVVYEMEVDGRLTYVNPAAQVLFGITPQHIEEGLTVQSLLIPEDRPRAGKNIGAVLRGETPGPNEYTVVVPNGRRVPVMIDSIPIVEEGRPVGLRGVVIDITDRKKLGQQLELSDRLAGLGTLAAGLAHEINNPLTSVLGNLQVLRGWLEDREGERTEAVGELIEDMTRSTRRIAQLAGDLRALARGKDDGLGPVDVAEAVKIALDATRHQLKNRARLEPELGDLPPVEATEHRLVQVFVNLIVNAVQSFPDGGAVEDKLIEINGRVEEDWVVVVIDDTGPGIDEAVLPELFEAFVTTKPGVGTGMGLAICRRVVEGVGGRIRAENRAEGGARFEVRLRRSRDPAPKDRGAAPGPVDLTGRRILAVDDEASVIRVVQRILRDADVTCASSGSEALELLATDRFDLVLCDLTMPDVNGRQVYEWILEHDDRERGAFAFMTGGSISPDHDEFIEAQAIPVIHKPFEVRRLRATVAQLL